MTDKFYIHKGNASDFGGLIYNYDYDGHTTMTDIASRIISDRKFEKRCKANERYRDTIRFSEVKE